MTYMYITKWTCRIIYPCNVFVAMRYERFSVLPTRTWVIEIFNFLLSHWSYPGWNLNFQLMEWGLNLMNNQSSKLCVHINQEIMLQIKLLWTELFSHLGIIKIQILLRSLDKNLNLPTYLDSDLWLLLTSLISLLI